MSDGTRDGRKGTNGVRGTNRGMKGRKYDEPIMHRWLRGEVTKRNGEPNAPCDAREELMAPAGNER
jgi:hypothetical protein